MSFQRVREDIFLILGVVMVSVLAYLGFMAMIGPYELSQLLIVVVFLSISVTIAEQVSRYQRDNEMRLRSLEAKLGGPTQKPQDSEA